MATTTTSTILELAEYRTWLTRQIVSATFSPFAARTQQFVKEQLGQADEKVRKTTGLVEMVCE